jgi:hypothetical protein
MVVVLCVGSAVARPAAGAICGDGVLGAGEACDASAPNGDAACPGRCVPPPKPTACQCAAISTDANDFAIIAEQQARLATSASVSRGGVAVTDAGGLLFVGKDASTPAAAQAIGDNCRLLPGSSVGQLFCNVNVIFPGSFVDSGIPFDFTPPVSFSNLPPFSTGSGGGLDVTVGTGETHFLAPGFYGNILVTSGGKLILHGLSGSSAVGRYDVLGIKVMSNGNLFADNPVVVNLKNGFKMTGQSIVGPSAFTSVQAGDMQFNVEQGAAKLGKGAFFRGHVRTAIGKIVAGRGTIAVGQLIAPKVTLQKSSVLQLEGGCGDGEKEVTEMCDATAPGGDAACPGKCIALGQPGQCTCSCSSNNDCDDHNACNGVETCDGGHCALGTPPNCDDHNQCTADCDPAVGCVNVALTDGTPCDDGNECTKGDACMGGVCHSGTARACDDGNSCTADSCDPQHGCMHVAVADGVTCSDNNACTTGDSCKAGHCVSGQPTDCNDLNACTTDTCNPLTGCAHANVNNGTSCAGTNPCTQLDVCNTGACVSGVTQLCGASDACTTISCTPTGPVGAQTAQCNATSTANCNDLNPCTVDSCDPVSGCHHTPAPNGSSCSGPSPCTALDVCNAGTCMSGVHQLCNDGNPCTTETCTVTGPVGSQTAQCNYTNLPNQTSCGPSGQVCTGGVCQ